MTVQILEIDPAVDAGLRLLGEAEPVHRELRPQLPSDYVGVMRAILTSGARMVVAATEGSVRGVAVFRLVANTSDGRLLHLDDLIVASALRSTGIGRALLGWLEREAVKQGCTSVAFESGTQRRRAHQFCFREGFTITSFYFKKPLS